MNQLLPSTLITAVMVWIAVAVGSCAYLLYKRWSTDFGAIRLNGDTFLVKTFLVAASLVSIISIGTGVQFLNPSAGIDQFLVIFVLVMWLKYSLTDLKQRLDMFVIERKVRLGKVKSKFDMPVSPNTLTNDEIFRRAEDWAQDKVGEVKSFHYKISNRPKHIEVSGDGSTFDGNGFKFKLLMQRNGRVIESKSRISETK